MKQGQYDRKGIARGPYKNMTLKTLKDLAKNSWIKFKGESKKEPFVTVKELKAEAVKWVKQIDSGEEVDCGIVRFSWDKRSQWTGPTGQALRSWIMHFFNITEADLK